MSDFAPLYTTRERIQIVVKILAVAAPVYLVSHYWMFPWLSAYAEQANCHFYGDITGVHLLLYGVFVFAPLSLVLLIWLLEGRRCMRVFRLGQNPLPGEKVLRKTRYKFGNSARTQPYVIFFSIAVLIGVSIWGGFVAQKLTREIAVCSSEQLGIQNTNRSSEGQPIPTTIQTQLYLKFPIFQAPMANIRARRLCVKLLRKLAVIDSTNC